MVAVGYTSKGKRLEFDCSSDEICCSYSNLVSLEIPDGVKQVYSHNNNLTELILPDTVTEVYCHNNKITELIIPSGVKQVVCDRGVKGLEQYIDKVEIILC